MDTIKQLQWRYATKKFDRNKKLSKTKLDILKRAFNLTATSFGLQTIKLVVIENEVLRGSLVKHSYNQKQVLDASHLLVICIQRDISTADVNAYYDNIKAIRNTSDTILEPYRLELIDMMKNMTVEARQQWSKNQAYISLGNLLTVCAVEGIDSCPMEGFMPEEFDTILELNKQNLKSVLLLPVGYRADDDMFAEFEKVRKSIDDAIIEL
ncbi:NAD(P)H-dependent oxidoreductase [Flavivirga algicola]|uniref:NAD(P)H-dependent oxidoreductase n=1 Tax=Flavivirga algicola TaxID=2729136 RepID=A0ABX1RQW9_9FLAO|nr:NAD(P)H-dependent oxidoreductase [Flavivirga algicola]NMH85947.1 NAD(P)H-dependent oxidoreductase [Flavivirga algicola]